MEGALLLPTQSELLFVWWLAHLSMAGLLCKKNLVLEVDDRVGMGRGDEQERQQEDREARQYQKNAAMYEDFWRQRWGHEGFADLCAWMRKLGVTPIPDVADPEA